MAAVKESMEKIVQANNSFAISLSKVLKESDESDNQLFSPSSLSIVMGMLYTGARGTTAAQIQKGMHYPEERCTFYTGYHSFMELMKEDDNNVTLESANRIYAPDKYEVATEFQRGTETHFGASTETVDFSKSKEAAKKINTWVEEKTKKKITDLITAYMLGESTKLVLINAVYFQGNWKNEFIPIFTQKMDFYVNDDEMIKNVPMMANKGFFPFAALPELDAKLLSLLYKGERFQMLLILPNKKTGLNKMMKKMTDVPLNTLVSKLKSCEVILSIPRFRLETTMQLEQALKKLGMVEIFDPAADLNNICRRSKLCVSTVIQKAFIEVNEVGTEAAAATGMGMVARNMSIIEPERFKADHPFMFAIHDMKTGMCFFVGKLIRPDPAK